MTVNIIEKNEDNNYILLEVVQPIQMPDDPQATSDIAHEFQAKLGRPVYRILDFSSSQLGFSDLVSGMGIEIGRPGGSSDLNLTHIFAVGANEIAKLGVNALKTQQDTYKSGDIHLVATADDAKKLIEELGAPEVRKAPATE